MTGEMLKKKMKETGVTQVELAERLGVARATVWNWCNDRTVVPKEMHEKICEALTCTMDELKGESMSDDDKLHLNGSKYYDPTAYKAIKNLEKKGGEKMEEFNRGEIFEYYLGSGEKRNALIVSSDERKNNKFISILVLKDEAMGDYCIPIHCGIMMFAACDQVSYASNTRFGNFIKRATDEEMAAVDRQLKFALDLDRTTADGDTDRNALETELGAKPFKEFFEVENEELKRKVKTLEKAMTELTKENRILREKPVLPENPAEVTVLTTERDLYKKLYEQMLERLIG